jgi:hypothetical protein
MNWIRYPLRTAWVLGTFPFLFLIYVTITVEGVRLNFQVLSTPLHKLPFPLFSMFKHFDGWRRADLAQVFAVVILICVYVSWHLNLRLSLRRDFHFSERWQSDNVNIFIRIVGGMLILSDCFFFFEGILHAGAWVGEAGGIFTAIVATIAYLAVLLLISFVTIWLEPTEETL